MDDKIYRVHLAPTYRDVGAEDETPRSIVPSHRTIEDGYIMSVHPASSMKLAYNVTDEGVKVPVIRMNCALAPSTLLFLPTPFELREVGKAMIAMADEIEGEATAAADAMWDKLRGGSGS